MVPDNTGGVLAPIISRVVTSHCWLKRDGVMKHLAVPLTQARVLEHLAGTHAYGVAQIEPGTSTTRIALLDFDSHKGEVSWEDMQALAVDVMGALDNADLPAAPFRSSGGAGIHLCILWDTPQDAYSVRKRLEAILSTVGLTPGVGGVAKSQVEIFPKQNSVPENGFGNMFILPLSGKSIPLDALELEPIPVSDTTFHIAESVPFVARDTPRETGDIPHSVELDVFRSALAAIPNSELDELDYDTWRNIIFAIHHETQGSPAGLTLAHEFSQQCSKYDPEFLDNRVWPHIKDSYDGENGGVTGRSVLHLARQHGWQEPLENDFLPDIDEEGKPVNRFQLASSRAQLPIKPDIIAGVIPDAEFGIIYGKSGAGKSFAAIDLAYHLAQGLPWRGRKTKQRNVFYIAAEGASGVRKRTAAYATYHNLSEDIPLYTCEGQINLHAKKAWNPVAEDINTIQAGTPGVIIIDTLSRSIAGVDENSAKDMSQVIANCQSLGVSTNCMVIVIAHAGKNEEQGVRGSSALRAAADFELSVSRYLDTELRSIKLTKSKDDIDGTQFPFKLTSVDIGVNTDGDKVFSAVAVVSDEEIPNVKSETTKDKKLADIVVDTYFLMAESTDDGKVDIEKLIDQVLTISPNPAPDRRTRLRRMIAGDRSPEIFCNDERRVFVRKVA